MKPAKLEMRYGYSGPSDYQLPHLLILSLIIVIDIAFKSFFQVKLPKVACFYKHVRVMNRDICNF